MGIGPNSCPMRLGLAAVVTPETQNVTPLVEVTAPGKEGHASSCCRALPVQAFGVAAAAAAAAGRAALLAALPPPAAAAPPAPPACSAPAAQFSAATRGGPVEVALRCEQGSQWGRRLALWLMGGMVGLMLGRWERLLVVVAAGAIPLAAGETALAAWTT
eukprot:CAMPEP_0202424028 /NCGR_PEP_ID=MMETSP1128-20130828/51687_1 /ASSEMBLY_ACC=CAM_ASM_000463 /TAXON_ID=3047 /ORGANISM="Dunaliella tertiolecta, Strain CCMP1320" /LENGTH=159 /DNA_ID=CAMNT_0049032163 /DNA_START=1206 /DNA_END=1685 /DNA_ORIENTATION=+